MDQLGVVTAVLVLSTLLMSAEDIRSFFRRGKGGKKAPSAPMAADAPAATGNQPADLFGSVLSDIESDDERRVQRAMTLVEKLPAASIVPALVQLLRHPREDVSSRAAKALLVLGAPESVEPLYLYFNARGVRT